MYFTANSAQEVVLCLLYSYIGDIFLISDVHDFSNPWAEHFCFAPITLSSKVDLRAGHPPGQTNYLHKCHIFHKDESHTFNQALLMMADNLTDCTKFSVVVMSCEDFDYSKKKKKKSGHNIIVYFTPAIICAARMASI